MEGDPGSERAERRVVERDLDGLAPAVALACVQRHRDRRGSLEGGEVRGEGKGRVDGASAVLVQPIDADGCRDDALPGAHAESRVVGGESRQRTVDQAAVRVRHRRGAQTEALHHAGTEVLDHDVRAGNQPASDGQVGGLLEIEDDAALVAIPGDVRRAVVEGSARGIDPDDVRALVGEQHAHTMGPSDVLPEVDHADAIQGAGHSTISSRQRTAGPVSLPSVGTMVRPNLSPNPPIEA